MTTIINFDLRKFMKNEIKEFFDLRKFELEKFIKDLRFKVHNSFTYFAKNGYIIIHSLFNTLRTYIKFLLPFSTHIQIYFLFYSN